MYLPYRANGIYKLWLPNLSPSLHRPPQQGIKTRFFVSQRSKCVAVFVGGKYHGGNTMTATMAVVAMVVVVVVVVDDGGVS